MGRRVDVTITYLEQKARPALPTPPRPPGKVALMRVESPPVHFYRYLYGVIGGAWYWMSRKRLSDSELSAIISDPSVHLFVLHIGGAPAGMAEIDARKADGADLKFFGLAPEFIGRGYGRYFLTHILDIAWSMNPKRLRLETCTLDHPAALPLYQKLGFTVFDQQRGHVDLDD